MAESQEISSMKLYVEAESTVFYSDGSTMARHRSITYDLRYFMAGTTEGLVCYYDDKPYIFAHWSCVLSKICSEEMQHVRGLQGNADYAAMNRHGFPIHATIHDGNDIIEAKLDFWPVVKDGKLDDVVYFRVHENIVRNGVDSYNLGVYVSCNQNELVSEMFKYFSWLVPKIAGKK